MRFSIRWLLAAMAYFALVVAAICTLHYVLVDAVWAVTLIATCYAVSMVCVAEGKRRAMAAGFIFLAMTNMICLFVAPNRVPAMRLFSTLGYEVIVEGEIPNRRIYIRGRTPETGGFGKTGKLVPAARAANAAGTLAAGLLGCYIGSLAYKQSRRE